MPDDRAVEKLATRAFGVLEDLARQARRLAHAGEVLASNHAGQPLEEPCAACGCCLRDPGRPCPVCRAGEGT